MIFIQENRKACWCALCDFCS